MNKLLTYFLTILILLIGKHSYDFLIKFVRIENGHPKILISTQK